MNIKNRTVALSASICVCASLFTACSKTELADVKRPLSDEEINSRYEEILSGAEQVELLDENYNPIVDNFTTVDFQFTDLSDEIAFNLPENSYASITLSSTNFSFFDNSASGESFEGSFKTSKGLGLSNTLAEHAAAYKIDQYGAVALLADGTYPDYSPGVICTRLTCGYSSQDGLEFSALPIEEIRRILAVRDPAQTAGTGISTDKISEIIGSSRTVALIDLYPNEAGTLNQLTISRFDRVSQD